MSKHTQPLIALPHGPAPLHQKIYGELRRLIVEGIFPPGSSLASSRQIAKDLCVSRNTVTFAINRLIGDRLVEARQGSGCYVLPRENVSAAGGSHTDTADVAGWIAPRPFEIGQSAVDLFPQDRWRKLQKRIWAGKSGVLHPSIPGGDPLLQQAIAAIVCPTRGIRCDPSQILITSSLQLSLNILNAALGLAGCSVVLEDPGYLSARVAFDGFGCRTVPVPVDARGLQVAQARFIAPECRLIYVTPAAQFPTCARLDEERGRSLAQWMGEIGGLVVEDDYDGHFRFDGLPPRPPLITEYPDHVTYVGTFNRLLFPGLRLAFMIVPERYIETARNAQLMLDGVPPLANQLVLRQFIEEGGFARQVRHCRRVLTDRRRALVAAIDPFRERLFEPEVNGAGLHLVLRPREVAEEKVVRALRAGGFAAIGLTELTADPGSAQSGVLLGFAAFSVERIAAHTSRLQEILTGLLT